MYADMSAKNDIFLEGSINSNVKYLIRISTKSKIVANVKFFDQYRKSIPNSGIDILTLRRILNFCWLVANDKTWHLYIPTEIQFYSAIYI